MKSPPVSTAEARRRQNRALWTFLISGAILLTLLALEPAEESLAWFAIQLPFTVATSLAGFSMIFWNGYENGRIDEVQETRERNTLP